MDEQNAPKTNADEIYPEAKRPIDIGQVVPQKQSDTSNLKAPLHVSGSIYKPGFVLIAIGILFFIWAASSNDPGSIGPAFGGIFFCFIGVSYLLLIFLLNVLRNTLQKRNK